MKNMYCPAKAAYQSLSVYEEVYSSSGILDMLIYAGNSDCLVSRKAPYSRLEHYDEPRFIFMSFSANSEVSTTATTLSEGLER